MAIENVMAVRKGKVIGPPRADGTMTWVNNNRVGAKNLNAYPYNSGDSGTSNGISWVVNDDGSVTLNGTATISTDFNFHRRNKDSSCSLYLPNGKYIISGVAEGCCNPDASSNKTFSLCMTCTKNGVSTRLGYDMGEGAICTVNGDDFGTDGAYVGFFITVWQGYTMDNVTFYPMIRVAEDTDPTYMPNAKTNRDLTLQNTISSEVLATGVTIYRCGYLRMLEVYGTFKINSGDFTELNGLLTFKDRPIDRVDTKGLARYTVNGTLKYLDMYVSISTAGNFSGFATADDVGSGYRYLTGTATDIRFTATYLAKELA